LKLFYFNNKFCKNLLHCIPGELPEPKEGAVAPERVVRQGEEAQLAQRKVAGR